MGYQDKNLTCSECRCSFAFTAEDQQLYGELGYDRPERCRLCLAAREYRRCQRGPDALRRPPELRVRIVPGASAYAIAVMADARTNGERLEYLDGIF